MIMIFDQPMNELGNDENLTKIKNNPEIMLCLTISNKPKSMFQFERGYKIKISRQIQIL